MSSTIRALLHKTSLFSSLTEEEVAQIRDICHLHTCRSATRLFARSQVVDSLYVVVQGAVHLVDDHNEERPVVVSSITRGDTFGNTGFSDDYRSEYAAIIHSASAEILELSHEDLAEYLKDHPDTKKKIENHKALAVTRRFISKTALFSKIPPVRFLEMLKKMEQKKLTKGQLLIRQGDEAHTFYIAKEGRFRVFKNENRTETISTIEPGDIIGEIALVTGSLRSANVEAETDSTVLCLDKEYFLKLLKEQDYLSSSIDDIIQSRYKAAPVPEEKVVETKQIPAEKAAPLPSVPPEAEKYKPTIPLRYLKGKPPIIKQHSEMDCGAACLTTICTYYGTRVSINHMRELARVGAAGASMTNLVRACRELGFVATPMVANYADLKIRQLPAIANWQGYHWIVIYHVDEKNVTIGDPDQGLITMGKEEFMEGWSQYIIFLEPTKKFEQVEPAKPALKQFKPYFVPHFRILFEVFLASVSLEMISMFSPLFTMFIIDEVIMKQETKWLLPSIGAMCVMMGMQLTISYSQQVLLLRTNQKINLNLLSDFYQHILSLPMSFFERRKIGDITTRFEEHENITKFFTETGMGIVLDAMTSVITLGIMYYINKQLTVVALILLSLNTLIVYIITPRLKQTYRELFAKEADTESYLIESLRGLATIKTLGVGRMVRWTYENYFISYINTYFKSLKYDIAAGISSGTLEQIIDITMLFMGASLVMKGEMTVGGLIAFTALVDQVSGPISQLVSSWDDIQKTINSVERMNDVLEAEVEGAEDPDKEKVHLSALQGHVELENLTFRYDPDAMENVIQNFTLQVKPGERIGFVGRSGSGKSTIIKLLYGFYWPTSGNISIDGFNIKDLSLSSTRSRIGMVPQKSQVFRVTIRENIAMAKSKASLSEIVEAAKMSGAHEFIENLPLGYDTLVEEEGANLSGGQLQRICIARAFLHKPDILILDEATSALDSDSERMIQQNIEDVFHDKTIFMIAHRLSTVVNCHKIVVIDHGNILETGPHEELLAKGGLYSHLCNLQRGIS